MHRRGLHTSRRLLSPNSSKIPWATVDPFNTAEPMKIYNRLNNEWRTSYETAGGREHVVVDPLNARRRMVVAPLTSETSQDFELIQKALTACPKSGLHNPLKRPERYLAFGECAARAADELAKPEVEAFFVQLIQRVMPKSTAQCLGEVRVTRQFLRTFAGDSTRFILGRGFSVSGDHPGQESKGYRWPYGPVAVISPFNFPLEIPALQAFGALAAGNQVVLKPAEKVAVVVEQFVRLLLHCGLPEADDDLLLLHSHGSVIEKLVTETPIRLTQFTGSSKVAEMLAEKTRGKVRIEDAGFNWKILGPLDGRAPSQATVDFVAYTSDQDAYAASGQKCSAQSCLFVHEDWATKTNFIERITQLASRRTFENLTIGPVLTWTDAQIRAHVDAVLRVVPGAKILFGGKPLPNRGDVPEAYGLFAPTAIRVSLSAMMSSDEAFRTCTKELFGPFQIVVDYKTDELDAVLRACERMEHHLTCAVVSKDPSFLHKVLAHTVNGTTYAGIRARTTGAPTNHWFGPAGDPRGAGIGTPEAVLGVWTCHREIVADALDDGFAGVKEWKTPEAS